MNSPVFFLLALASGRVPVMQTDVMGLQPLQILYFFYAGINIMPQNLISIYYRRQLLTYKSILAL